MSGKEWRVVPPPPCEGCGGPDHGSVNEGLRCLIVHLRAARADLRELRARLAVVPK